MPVNAIKSALEQFGVDETVYGDMKSNGLILNFYKTLTGEVKHNFVAQPDKPAPRILLVEKYRLSTYLGQYGAGRTVNTFSLLPGEKTTISVSTYKRTSTSATEASSILDSVTNETASDFGTSMQAENTSKESVQDTFNYHAEASAQASWGWGKAQVSGGVSGGTESAREEFAKNVASSTSSNAAKASAKRDVQVNTSFETKTEAGEETSITREIRNINVGRTLNFVFRQMNQEFITLLHLVDVRVAFFNGFRGTSEEVALPDLDQLLEKYIKEPKRADVKRAVLQELRDLRNWKDQPVTDFIEQVPATGQPKYWRVRRGHVTRYQDEMGNSIIVPGVVIQANKNVMRTDGVIVEALLGQALGLDDYSIGLQDEKVKSQRLDNDLKDLEARRERARLAILEAKDAAGARLYQQLYPPPESDDRKRPPPDES